MELPFRQRRRRPDRREERRHVLEGVGKLFLGNLFVVFVQAVVALPPGVGVLVPQLLPEVLAHQRVRVQGTRPVRAFGRQQAGATQSAHPRRAVSMGGPPDQVFVPGSYTSTVVWGGRPPMANTLGTPSSIAQTPASSERATLALVPAGSQLFVGMS